MLACIAQTIATPTRKTSAATEVKQCCPPSAIPAICGSSAAEPRAATAEMAPCPHDWHVLLRRLPLGTFPTADTKTQDDRVDFSSHADTARRFSAMRPGVWEVLTSTQAAFAVPAPRINWRTHFAGRTTAVGSSHQVPFAGIIEIIRKVALPATAQNVGNPRFCLNFAC